MSRRSSVRLLVVLGLVLFGGLHGAHASDATEYSYQVLFDTDNNQASGCSVSVEDATVGSTTVPGVELLVTAHVRRTDPDGTVTGITALKCAGGTFGSPLIVSGGSWPVGRVTGVGAADVIEGFLPAAMLEDAAVVRVVFAATRTGESDVILTTTGAIDAAPILFRVSSASTVPLLSTMGMVCSVLLLGTVAV